MESRKEDSRPQVRQTPYPTQYSESPQVGVGLLPALPPGQTRVRKGLSGEPGALPPLRRLRASAWPLLQRLPELHSEVAVTLVKGPQVSRAQRQEEPGALAVPKTGGGGCGSTHQFWLVFRFLFVGGAVPRAPLVAPAPTGFLAAASCSRRHRPGMLHLSGPVTCATNPTSPQLKKSLGAVPLPHTDSAAPLPEEGVCLPTKPLISGLQYSGFPDTPDATRRCHYSALGQALPLSRYNYHDRCCRSQGGV